MKSARTFVFWMITSIGLILWATHVKAAPVATAEQIQSCTNAVVLQLDGVPRSEVMTASDVAPSDGAGRLHWETRDGRSGSCWISTIDQSIQVEIENTQITNPVVLEDDATAIPGITMIVRTDGGGLNLRRSPAGEVTGMIGEGSTVVLTGKTNGEWVEIEGGNWVSRYHLVHEPRPVSASETPGSDVIDENPERVALEGTGGSNTAIVRSGAGINIRRSPDGEIFASVPDGTTVILTGQRSGGWVEIEGGGWVSEAFLQPQ